MKEREIKGVLSRRLSVEARLEPGRYSTQYNKGRRWEGLALVNA